MKRAYIDVSLEMLGDILQLYKIKAELENVSSPMENNGYVRLYVVGDGLPDECTDSATDTRLKLNYEGTFSGIKLTVETAPPL